MNRRLRPRGERPAQGRHRPILPAAALLLLLLLLLFLRPPLGRAQDKRGAFMLEILPGWTGNGDPAAAWTTGLELRATLIHRERDLLLQLEPGRLDFAMVSNPALGSLDTFSYSLDLGNLRAAWRSGPLLRLLLDTGLTRSGSDTLASTANLVVSPGLGLALLGGGKAFRAKSQAWLEIHCFPLELALATSALTADFAVENFRTQWNAALAVYTGLPLGSDLSLELDSCLRYNISHENACLWKTSLEFSLALSRTWQLVGRSTLTVPIKPFPGHGNLYVLRLEGKPHLELILGVRFYDQQK